MLFMGPEELMENQGRIRYLSLFLRYSIEEDGLMSRSPLRSSLFSLDGTPFIKVYFE
jgi:hypothetical protein